MIDIISPVLVIPPFRLVPLFVPIPCPYIPDRVPEAQTGVASKPSECS